LVFVYKWSVKVKNTFKIFAIPKFALCVDIKCKGFDDLKGNVAQDFEFCFSSMGTPWALVSHHRKVLIFSEILKGQRHKIRIA